MTNKQSIPEIDLGPRQRIALRLINMPPRMHTIARWLTDNWLTVPMLNMTRAAKMAGTTRSDMWAFVKRLGYKSWHEFRLSVSRDVTEKISKYYGLEDKTEAYYTIYQHLSTEIEYEQAPKCYKCGNKSVFWAKKHWYFATKNGQPEPEIQYCPFCGQKLNPSYPINKKWKKRQ